MAMMKLRIPSIWMAIAFGAGMLDVGFLRPSPAAPAGMPLASTMLTGSTRAAAGGALEGVAVSARAVNGTITTSVYSDEQGNYYFPALPGGKYRVWAQAVGFEADRAETTLSPARETRQDFTLKPAKDFTNQLASFEYIAALPEDTPANRRMRAIFNNTCVSCHNANFVLQNRFDEAGWKAILTTMETLSVVGRPVPTNPFIHHHKDELAAYLARMRGPGPSPMQFKPYPRPKGDAARVVITEYSVPPAESPGELVDQDGNDWSEGVPSVGNGARGVHDLAIDLNGSAWVTDGEVNRNRSYFKVDAQTGKVTDFRIPGGANGFPRGSHGMVADQKGIIWVTVGVSGTLNNSGNLGRIDPKTGKLDIFTPPPGLGGTGVGITLEVDAKGKVWSTSIPGATVFDPAKEKFSYFKSPTPGVGGYGIAGDADGNGWFCDPGVDIVGFADFKTGKVSEIPLTPRPGMEELLTAADREFYKQVQTDASAAKITAQGPRRMGTHGNYVWWPNWWGGSISKADIRSHEVSYYPLPIPGNPYTTAVDKNGVVWTALLGDEYVAKFDPPTAQWTLYKLPSLGNELRYITVDNHKDPVEVWVPSYRTSKIARLQFRTQEQLQQVAMASANGQRK
jgi:streptogramin lyase